MKKYFKLVVLMLILVSFILVISPAQQQITLRIIWWGSQDRHNRTLKVIDLFQKKYPNIKIVSEYTGWSEYYTKLTTMAAGGNLPDIMQQDHAYIRGWVEKGLLLPLDDLVAQGVINLKDVSKSIVDSGRLGGKLYAINLGNNSQAFAIDPELFRKAGVPLPPILWTWDDFKRIARIIHRKLGIYGAAENLGDHNVFRVWTIENGGYLFSEDGKSLGYEDDNVYASFYKMLLELQDEGVIPSRDVEVARGSVSPEQRFLCLGKSAMQFTWSNQLTAMSTALKGKPLKLYMLPTLNGKVGNFLKPSMFFAINAKTKYPKEAAMFINFFINDIEAAKILMAERGVPVSKRVQLALKPLLTPVEKEMFNFIATVEKYGAPTPPPDPERWQEIYNNVYTPLYDQIMYKKITPEEAAKKFREQVTQILRK
ncbi:ABC transporter substrate-binding protein [Dictyoglomus thermophilum]|uniref:YesO n=1 Tax=Dictyoglomus thermophilum (strain ATCC 35947 / DSM 3960 / H-6-12) TaxID=309799 RepID=B5YCE1_DICT6|nr:sugar ABC transporter substrate-binding protein [Dictyoglomus thermophilum]ACI19215.1 YesO [Dictyoglomus thermophilum H-6-12]